MTANTSTETVVVAQRCWDGLAETPSGHTEVLVRGGRIAEVGDRVERGAGPVVDLGDRMLLPGFIDCHIHTTVDPSALLAAFVADPAPVIALRALPVLRDLLDRGFTTVRDLATFAAEPITIYLRDALAHGLVTGPRMLVAPHLISARGAHGDISTLLAPEYGREIGVLADGPAAVTRAVREEIRAGANWIKFGATGGFGTPTDDPGETTYTQQEMDALVAAATDLGVPCTPHAYGDDGVARAVHAGVRSIEHGNLASAETLSLMQQRGVFLVPTQFMVLDALDHLDDEDYWQGKDPAEREKFHRYADQLRDSAHNVAASDVRVAFGTDAGMFPHHQNWKEFPAMAHTGITPLRALRAATSTAADLLRRPDLGRIQPGATADLIALTGNPFDDIGATRDVDFVMHDGAVHRPVARS
ncbi:amidohydrolase family protein [Planosporangium thailandense]|uniref:Amidohydrolase family protein n=1 Tax=Planosporangium thailandense TaxID=765197 RepID=A0ABX0Y1V3_9ACTN|nr:amidohydrolase family protein [Planosporangium thailandense]NJC71329.1 amidohydrolase family protein [Planosporangium thailandense]